MKKKGDTSPENEKEQFPGYPLYPSGQDIYNKHKVEKEIDPETGGEKVTEETTGELNEKDFSEDVSGSDLDVPGSELDDTQEDIGSEDEENNLYSQSQN